MKFIDHITYNKNDTQHVCRLHRKITLHCFQNSYIAFRIKAVNYTDDTRNLSHVVIHNSDTYIES
jgi:hypothetical protein